jgi:quinol monooxygenase YgiN
MSQVGLLVRLEAKPQRAEDLVDFLKGALPAAKNEPGTASWFALRIGPTTFGIYDSFTDDTARQKHLSGPIAAALTAKAPELLAKPPRIEQIDILASKLVPNSQVNVALVALFEAKPGKENELASHLSSAHPLVQEEPATQAWFAIRLGPSTFGIYDAFPDDSGRKAHLSGHASDMLTAKFPALLAKPPSIEQVDVLAAKFPKWVYPRRGEGKRRGASRRRPAPAPAGSGGPLGVEDRVMNLHRNQQQEKP